MAVIENSVLIRLIAGLWAALSRAWGKSVVGRALEWMGGAAANWTKGSGVCAFLSREGTLPRYWPGSLSHTLFTVIVNFPCALARWLYRKGEKIWNGSVAFQTVSAMGGVSFFFLGLLMLVMLVVPHDRWNNFYGLLGAFGVAALFAVGSAVRPKRRLEPAFFGPYLPLYLICIGSALAISLSTKLSMRFFSFHVISFLLMLLVVSSIHKPQQLKLVIALVVVGVAVAALYGCYQGYVGVEIVASQQDLRLNAGMPGRVYSFFDNPNNFAEVLVMLIPLDLALVLCAKTWRGKLWAFLALVPCVAAIGFTYSRSGWIGLCLAVVIFLALENWRLVPLMIVLGLCAIPFLPETIYNRILTIGNLKDSSTSYRFAIYDATAELMGDYWYRGVGLGSDVMQRVFRGYPAMFDGSFPIHTHNNYLQMWGETGILGLISYLAVLAYGVKCGLKAYYQTMDRQVRHILAAALGAFGGILVIGIAEYTWFYPRNMFVYWFLFGVIMCCVKLGHPRRAEKGRQAQN
ncbi:hypothetical protein D1159_08155 [Pseudoflavonifractor sp. 524-17]|uniref:O-antigen ligase family protein n=1 Tax=Pseudoflavonifractor sp. 524-17 TaxID=2304577 RepID=UPI00137A9A27|nr:O-antigen ligase family protein [Pseudoflavonifractor sp. 524-17]NCE64559.1 hypothetical protein [Pseudoflavonifractor sp. 524-17]